jgi:hypothetical protein
MLIDALIAAASYLLAIIPLITVGVIIAELVIELKWVDRLCFLFSPILRFSHMRDELCLSFTTALGSPTAAFAIIADLYEKKQIDQRELILASLATTFPGSLAQWRSALPLLIPLVGIPGLLFFGFVMVAEFIKASIALILARVLLKGNRNYRGDIKGKIPHHTPLKEALKRSLTSARKILIKIFAVTVPVTIAVYILMDAGLFDLISLYLDSLARYLPVPPEALSIIAAQQLSYVAAYTIAGNTLVEGVLSGREVTLALLLGDVLASIVNLRFKIPYYIGIFSPRLGIQVLLLSLLMRVGLLLLIIFVLVTLGW